MPPFAPYLPLLPIHLVLDLCVGRGHFAALLVHSLLPEPEAARCKEDKKIRGERDSVARGVIAGSIAEY